MGLILCGSNCNASTAGASRKRLGHFKKSFHFLTLIALFLKVQEGLGGQSRGAGGPDVAPGP